MNIVGRALLIAVIGLLDRFALRAEPLHPVLSRAGADSARLRLSTSPPDTNQVKVLLRLAEYYLAASQAGNLAQQDSAEVYTYGRRAQQLSRTLHYRPGQIRSQYVLGNALLMRRDSAQASSLLRQALANSQRLGNKVLEAEGWRI